MFGTICIYNLHLNLFLTIVHPRIPLLFEIRDTLLHYPKLLQIVYEDTLIPNPMLYLSTSCHSTMNIFSRLDRYITLSCRSRLVLSLQKFRCILIEVQETDISQIRNGNLLLDKNLSFSL